MNTYFLSLRRKIFHFFLFQFAFMKEIFRGIARYLKLGLFYQRRKVITALSEHPYSQEKRPKVFVAIAHITSTEEASNIEKASVKIDRLKKTIDSLLVSFAHCELTIVINTLPGRNIIAYLPEYQINCISVQEEPDCDPMLVEFRLQDEFVKKVDDFDWFLFIEDDIIIHDGFFLEKLEKFNQKCGYDNAVLLPNRYEFCEGIKRYIDLIIDSGLAWNKLSAVVIEGIKFAEYTNPHAALYCLSKSQMKTWIKSGRIWKNKVILVGPLEDAATHCLLECFSLYKPHPQNLHFLEVEHYDTKYSRLYPEASLYRLSPISNSLKPSSES